MAINRNLPCCSYFNNQKMNQVGLHFLKKLSYTGLEVKAAGDMN